jgi:hypothetical protein
MKVYLLVSDYKGKKDFVAHYRNGDDLRCEVFKSNDEVELHKNSMLECYGYLGVEYKVVEVEV